MGSQQVGGGGSALSDNAHTFIFHFPPMMAFLNPLIYQITVCRTTPAAQVLFNIMISKISFIKKFNLLLFFSIHFFLL